MIFQRVQHSGLGETNWNRTMTGEKNHPNEKSSSQVFILATRWHFTAGIFFRTKKKSQRCSTEATDGPAISSASSFFQLTHLYYANMPFLWWFPLTHGDFVLEDGGAKTAQFIWLCEALRWFEICFFQKKDVLANPVSWKKKARLSDRFPCFRKASHHDRLGMLHWDRTAGSFSGTDRVPKVSFFAWNVGGHNQNVIMLYELCPKICRQKEWYINIQNL